MINARQIRAARALLNWNQTQLADFAGVARSSIKNIENEITAPRADSAAAIQEAFENHGVEFLPGSGVRLRNEMVTVLEGENANEKLLEDVYNTLSQTSGGEVLITGLKEFVDPASDDYKRVVTHIEKLAKINATERVLLEEGDTNFISPWECYRWIPKDYFSEAPFQLYGNKLALISWGPPQQIVIIENPLFAASFRNLFNFAWDRAVLPPKPKGHK